MNLSPQQKMLYSYNTPIYARVKSAKLGLLRWIFSSLILIYILGYSMLYRGGYLQSESPIGTVRFSVQHPGHLPNNQPCHDPFQENCILHLHASKDLSYCSENPTPREHKKFHCRHLDATETITVFEKSVLIATRITEYIQERTCLFTNPNKCTQLWKTKTSKEQTYFIGDVDDLTLVLDHAIDTPTLGITAASRTSPKGMLISTNDVMCQNLVQQNAPCEIAPTLHTSGLDVFQLSTLIQLATEGGTLDETTSFASNHSLRYTGMVLVVLIEYSNFIPLYGVSNTVTYHYKLKFIKGTGAKHMHQQYLTDSNERILQKRHGVLMVVKFAGSLHAFDWQTCLVTLTTSLALLAVATTIVDGLALYILRGNGQFEAIKYQDVVLKGDGGDDEDGDDGHSSKWKTKQLKFNDMLKEEMDGEDVPLLP